MAYDLPKSVSMKYLKDQYMDSCATFYGTGLKYKNLLDLIDGKRDPWLDPLEEKNPGSATPAQKQKLPDAMDFNNVQEYIKACEGSPVYMSLAVQLVDAGLSEKDYAPVVEDILMRKWQQVHPGLVQIMEANLKAKSTTIKQIQKAGNNSKQVQIGIISSSTAKPLFKEDVTVKTVTKPSLWSRFKKAMHSIFYKKVPDGDYRKETH